MIDSFEMFRGHNPLLKRLKASSLYEFNVNGLRYAVM